VISDQFQSIIKTELGAKESDATSYLWSQKLFPSGTDFLLSIPQHY